MMSWHTIWDSIHCFKIQFSPLTKPTKKLYCKLSALYTFCMHCTDYQYITECRQLLFLYAYCMHLSALIYTRLHVVCTRLPPSLRTSAPNCTTVIPPAQFGIREAVFWLEQPKNLPPVIVLTAPTQALRHDAVAEWNRGRISMQTSADKCRQVQTAVQKKNEVVYTT